MPWRRVGYFVLVMVCIAMGLYARYTRTRDIDVPNWVYPIGFGVAALAIYVGVREGRARQREKSRSR